MELSIDTASELASLALSREGEVLAEVSWRCRRNQTAELLPTLDRLLAQASATKQDISAVFVSLGPGAYTGLRVGISTAQALAFALRLPVMGAGRLELDALAHESVGRPVVPLHWAGRGELAWAVYEPYATGAGMREALSPRLARPEQMAAQAPADALFCGEVRAEVAELIRVRLPSARIAPPARLGRAGYLAGLGYQRLQREGGMPPALLLPIYLREAVAGLPEGQK